LCYEQADALCLRVRKSSKAAFSVTLGLNQNRAEIRQALVVDLVSHVD
jgi:hypothetical protein